MKPLFQRRHYEWLADFICDEKDNLSAQMIQRLARALARDNPSFVYDQFVSRSLNGRDKP